MQPHGLPVAPVRVLAHAAVDGTQVAGPAGLWAGLARLVRALGVWFLFATFGVGAVILAGVVIPLLVARGGERADRELTAQRLIHRAFRAFLRLGDVLQLMSVSESGTARLRGAGLVVANHPTLLDVVYLISCLPQADCIVKREAWRNPFLRGIVRAAGYIPNHEGEALVAACAERLRAGRTLVLFPEGSRSPRRGLGTFKRGAARIALRSGSPITPVVLRCDPPALAKGEPGYLPARKLEFSIAVGEPLSATQLADAADPPAVAARHITEQLHSYFEARLDHGRE